MDYDYHLRSGETRREANQARRETSKLIREWERGENLQHGLYPILVKEWGETLPGTERAQYLEPGEGD